MRLLYLKILAVIILCCLGILIYSNTFHSPFHFDDKEFIVENLSIRKFTNLGTIWQIWPARFITYLTFAFNYHFHKLNVFGYHLFNLVVHSAAAVLVWWLILLTLSAPQTKNSNVSRHSGLIALFGALIFLSHPLQTEAVTYIYQRSTSLAAFFYLFSLCLYLKSRLLQTNNRPVSKWLILYIFSWIAGIAGMFTKENTATLPLMIILCEFCFFRTDKVVKWKYAIPFLIILPIVPLTLFLLKGLIFSINVQKLMHQPISSVHYFLTQIRVMATYLRLLFIPLNQNLDYDYPIVKSLLEPSVLASLMLLVLILIIAIRIFSRYRLISFGIFWFFLTLLPESSFIPLEDVIFEHRLYLPMAGFSIFLASLIYNLFKNRSLKPMVAVLLVIVSSYSILTYRRNLIWKDELTLWNDTVHKSPKKARPYNNRGVVYRSRENLNQALLDYSRAIEINPDYDQAYYNRGIVYRSQENLNQAILDYNRAIEINPNYADAYNNRGVAYRHQGNLNQAILDFSQAIEINPKYAEAYNNRGVAYRHLGNLNQAILDFSQAIEINPNYAKAYNNRAMAYFENREYAKSWEDVQRAQILGYEFPPAFIAQLKDVSPL